MRRSNRYKYSRVCNERKILKKVFDQSQQLTLSLLDRSGQKRPLCYFTMSNARRFYLSKEMGGKGLNSLKSYLDHRMFLVQSNPIKKCQRISCCEMITGTQNEMKSLRYSTVTACIINIFN